MKRIFPIIVALTGCLLAIMAAVQIANSVMPESPDIEIVPVDASDIDQRHQPVKMAPGDLLSEPWNMTPRHDLEVLTEDDVTVRIAFDEQNGKVVLLPYVSGSRGCFLTCRRDDLQVMGAPGQTYFIRIGRGAMYYAVGEGYWAHSEVFRVRP